MSSENIQTYETQKHQIISSEPPELSYQVSEKKNKKKKTDQNQDTNTPSDQKQNFSEKTQILFVEKCYYWERERKKVLCGLSRVQCVG